MYARNAELEAIVEKLPVTKDGVRVVTGEDIVYLADHQGKILEYEIFVMNNREAECLYTTIDRVHLYYSTREAARKAGR
jgi:hypothetical protein